MYKNKHQWARKIGFGFRPEDEIPLDIDAWSTKQITDEFPSYGLNKAGLWPEEYNFPIKQRFERLHKHITYRDKVQAENIDGQVEKELIKVSKRAAVVDIYDVYKLWNSAIYDNDMFKQRLLHFWTNHFTVGGSGNYRNFVIGDLIYNVIYKNLNGSFDDLLYLVTSHPGMLDYLDNQTSIGENSKEAKLSRKEGKTAGLNDNLARELLELHTVSPARKYSETDIRNTAKVLAGWGVHVSDFVKEFNNHKKWKNISGNTKLEEFVLAPYVKGKAEPGKKIVMGKTFSSGPKALRKLTNMLANDDFTAQHLSKKLAIHFIGENATKGEVKVIYDTWKKSNGDLAAVHRATLKVAQATKNKKFLWPSTWMFQSIRVSGARFIKENKSDGGFGSIKDNGRPHYEALGILEEIGHSFWAARQPDGYSEKKLDWVSTEHLDRRIRIASRIFRAGPSRSGEEIADLLDFSDKTKLVISKGRGSEEKFIIALCSSDFMEV
jgi:uncharacterized protein (DUF1800 family)